jgi:ABC-type nitrate/sulfonate/bicarbonate transport system substrate-binding protein
MKSTLSFVVVFAALVAAGVPAQTLMAADKVGVSLGASDDPVYLPNFIAIDKGYYQQLNLDVELTYAGGGVATPALMSGTLEFSTSTGSAVSAILKGAALKVVMTLSETVPWKLWSTQPEIRALEDLQGKSVGVQTRGDLFELSMRAALMKRGLSGDYVSYSPLGFGSTQRLALIQSGALPAVLLTNLEEKIARDKGLLNRAHLLIDMGQDVRIPNNGLAITNKMSTTNPFLVERFVRGTLMGVRYMKAHPDGALRIFAKRVPNVPLDLLRSSVDEAAAAMLPEGTTARPVQEAEIALRSAMLGLSQPQVPGPDTIFDYSLVLEAAERLQSAHWIPTE